MDQVVGSSTSTSPRSARPALASNSTDSTGCTLASGRLPHPATQRPLTDHEIQGRRDKTQAVSPRRRVKATLRPHSRRLSPRPGRPAVDAAIIQTRPHDRRSSTKTILTGEGAEVTKALYLVPHQVNVLRVVGHAILACRARRRPRARGRRWKEDQRHPGEVPHCCGAVKPADIHPPLPNGTGDIARVFPLIQFAEEILLVHLFPWRRWLAIHALEPAPDGQLRFRNVVPLSSRQNSKSMFSQVLALWWLFICDVETRPQHGAESRHLRCGRRQPHHRVDDDDSPIRPEVAELVQRVVQVNGKSRSTMVTSSRYKVKAANRRAGRGLTGQRIMSTNREHKCRTHGRPASPDLTTNADASVVPLQCQRPNVGGLTRRWHPGRSSGRMASAPPTEQETYRRHPLQRRPISASSGVVSPRLARRPRGAGLRLTIPSATRSPGHHRVGSAN